MQGGRRECLMLFSFPPFQLYNCRHWSYGIYWSKVAEHHFDDLVRHDFLYICTFDYGGLAVQLISCTGSDNFPNVIFLTFCILSGSGQCLCTLMSACWLQNALWASRWLIPQVLYAFHYFCLHAPQCVLYTQSVIFVCMLLDPRKVPYLLQYKPDPFPHCTLWARYDHLCPHSVLCHFHC